MYFLNNQSVMRECSNAALTISHPVLLLPLPYDLQGVFSTCLGAFDMSEEPRMQQLPPLASPQELTPPGLKVRWWDGEQRV